MPTKNTVYVRLGLEGAEEITAQLDKIGRAGQDAFVKIAKAAEAAAPGTGSKITKSLYDMEAAMVHVRTASKNMGAAIKYTEQQFTSFSAALRSTSLRFGAVKLAVDTVAGAIFILGKQAIDTVDELDRQSQALGFTIEGYTGLVGVAEAASVGQDTLAGALQRVNLFMQKQQEAADKAAAGLGKTSKALSDSQLTDIIDGADDVLGTLDDVTSGYEDLGNAAEDSNDKIKTTANAGAEALKKLGLSFDQLKNLSPEDRIFALADGFQRMGESAERNAVGIALFGQSAVKLIPLLAQGSRELKDQIEQFRKYGFSVTEAQKKIAQLGDNALDKAALALKGFRLQLGLAFAPVVTEGANAFAEFIADNLESMKEWANRVAAVALQLVKDIVNTLKGLDGAVENKWLIDLRDGLLLAKASLEAFVTVAKFAFNQLAEFLAPFAVAINAVFGTNFTGQSLAAGLVLMKFLGILRLVGAGLRLFLVAPINLAISAVRGLILITPYLSAFFSTVSTIISTALPIIIAFLAANPELVILGATVAALAGGVIYLTTQQNALQAANADATEGLDELATAQLAAADGTKQHTDALIEQQEAVLNQRRMAILDARDRVAEAQALVAEREADLKAATGYRAGVAAASALTAARAHLKVETEALAQREKNLADAQKRVADNPYKKIADDTAKDLAKLTDATDKAADGFVKIKIHMGAAGVKIQEVPKELDEAAKKAKAANDKIAAALADPTPENDDVLSATKKRAEDFVNAMDATIQRFKGLVTDLRSSTGVVGEQAGGVETDFSSRISAIFNAAEEFTTRATASMTEKITGLQATFTNALDAMEIRFNTFKASLTASLDAMAAKMQLLGGASPNGGAGAGSKFGAADLNDVIDVRDAQSKFRELVDSFESARQTITNSLNDIVSDADGVNNTLVDTFDGIGDNLQNAVTAAQANIKVGWTDVTNSVAANVGSLTAILSSAAQQIAAATASAFTGMESAIKASMNAITASVSGMVSQVESLIARLRTQLASLQAQIRSAQSAAARSDGGQRRAGGGAITGYGGPTQDNIPVWASVGEFMVRAAAVKRVGLPFLAAVNSGRYSVEDLLRRFLNMRFADGGLISMPSAGIGMPSLMGATSARAGGPFSALTLVLDGQTFNGITGPADTIARLERAAKRRETRSMGRVHPYDRG